MARSVILDTDIGTDIDDTWALAMLLASPELDLRLVTTVSGDARHRAALCARLLAIAGRQDVPIGIGIGGPLDVPPALAGTPQAAFVGPDDAALAAHPVVHGDGVDAMIATILAAPAPVTVLAIGPLTNVAEALRRCPQIAARVRLVGMHGSVRVGYRGAGSPSPEYNVRADVPAAQAALSAAWDITITPLDSCGSVVLKDDAYRRFHAHALAHPGSMAAAVLENYRVWLAAVGAPSDHLERRSTILFDTVAVYLAYADEVLAMETLGISVDDAGYTREDPAGRTMQVATGWRDAAAFDALLLDRLCW